MKRIIQPIVFYSIFLTVNLLSAQKQFIRIEIIDKESQMPITGSEVILKNNFGPILKQNKIDKGQYSIEAPLGRYNLIIISEGYQTIQQNGILITSGKEVILRIEMEQDITKINQITIHSNSSSDNPNNDGALVSARLFTVDETDRFAGSRGDPARMASNFAGVQGADDSRNDIVVRGNSPAGILWRIEGIDIPNPNHFAIPGTTGGSVSIINNKILANSDFFTGAFPAEYGNGIAGAFDLKLRKGNSNKNEVSSQLGILGWDILTEGPLNKNGASYLLTYRYSTLSMFNALNIPIGTDAIPQYQDASFNLNFPLKENAQLKFFGLGGKSNIDIMISDKTESTRNLYGDNDRDQFFGSNMYVLGCSYTKPINKNSYFKGIVSFNSQEVQADHQLVYRKVIDTFEKDGEIYNRFQIDSIIPNLHYRFLNQSIGVHLFINTRLSPVNTLKYGLQYRHYFYNFFDSNLNINPTLPNLGGWDIRWNAIGSGDMIIPYAQLKTRWNKRLTTITGVQSQYFGIKYNPQVQLSGTQTESHSDIVWFLPRFSAEYRLDTKNTLNFGMGLHAQNQSEYIYFYNIPGQPQPHNLGMGLTRSAHYILGWNYNFMPGSRIKMETYYQNLWNIPIEVQSSSFSLSNTGSGFSRFFPNKLINNGIGRNYGIELTLERFFSKGFYYLFSGSLFKAEYQGSDGIWRNSDFNTDYAVNALFAKEFKIRSKNVLNIGGKATFAGARRFSPIDSVKSVNAREYIELDAAKNTERFDQPYMRFDIRIAYRINAKKSSHEIAFDLVNFTNNKNILNYTFINEPPYKRIAYQLGFLPLFYYRIDFSL